jgi:hypothetical protein
MPSRRQLSGAAEVRKSNEKRGQFKERCRQGVEIRESGFEVYPCRHCTSENKECFIMPEKYEKCNACTRRGKPCVREFHTDKEWSDLRRLETETETKLREKEEEQTRLMMEIIRLRKMQRLLKERGLKMSDHNKLVSRVLDQKNPISEEELEQFEREFAEAKVNHAAPLNESRQLSDVSEVPTLTQLIQDLPPDLVDELQCFAGGRSELVVDNLSDSR